MILFELEPLPYAPDALEPYIGAETVDIHYRKHHAGHFEKLCAAVRTQPLAQFTLEVWEHAYYLNYRHDRARYVEACIDHLLNWRFAGANFAAANIELATDPMPVLRKGLVGSRVAQPVATLEQRTLS